MSLRRFLTVTLALFLLAVVGVLAYPYVRYRAVTKRSHRFFEDRFREAGPGGLQPPSCVYRTDGTVQSVGHKAGYAIRMINADGVIVRAMTVVDGIAYEAFFGSDGGFLSGAFRDHVPADHVHRFPLTEAEAREALGPLLEPDGMPWPWWTKLPYFAAHLRGE